MPKTKSGRPKLTRKELYERDCAPLIKDLQKSMPTRRGKNNVKFIDYTKFNTGVDKMLYVSLEKEANKKNTTVASVVRDYIEDFCIAHSQDAEYMDEWIDAIRKASYPQNSNDYRVGVLIHVSLRKYIESLTSLASVYMTGLAYQMIRTMREERRIWLDEQRIHDEY